MFKKLLKSVRGSFTHTPRTIRMVWGSSPGGTTALCFLTIAAALVPLAIAWVGKTIMDSVVSGNKDATLHYVLVELALVATQAIVQRGLGLLRSLIGARLSVDINVQIMEKALTLELRHFENAEFYDQLTKARREASSRPLSMVYETFQLLQNGLTLAGYIALLIRFSPWAVGGLVLAAIPATVAEMRFSQAAFRLRNWRSPDTRRLNYLEYVLANDNHAKEVKLFGLGPMFLSRYKELGEMFFREDRTLAVKRAVWAYALSLIATGAFYGCYVVMAVATAAGKLTLGNMTLYVVAFRQGQQAFQSILTAIGSMYEDNLYMSNLFQYFAIETNTGAQLALPPAAVLEEEGIRFEGVGFKYPGNDKWALEDLNVFIPRGQSLALVGHNGAGKTTFIKLLTRLYEPTVGRILLDGRDLRAWDPEKLRARIGVIFQDFNEYQLKVRENVGVGSVDHMEDELRLHRAVDRGGAKALIADLKGGLDAQLGRWFQDGAELSGGQWQKIALARAFMREEADILVLDEPTAALDAEAEHAVFERFRQLTKNPHLDPHLPPFPDRPHGRSHPGDRGRQDHRGGDSRRAGRRRRPLCAALRPPSPGISLARSSPRPAAGGSCHEGVRRRAQTVLAPRSQRKRSRSVVALRNCARRRTLAPPAGNGLPTSPMQKRQSSIRKLHPFPPARSVKASQPWPPGRGHPFLPPSLPDRAGRARRARRGPSRASSAAPPPPTPSRADSRARGLSEPAGPRLARRPPPSATYDPIRREPTHRITCPCTSATRP